MPQRRSSFRKKRDRTSRFIWVTAFLFLAIVLIGSPLQKYFAQRAQINALRAQVTSSRSELAQARKELELWKDSDYIKSQARARLHYVLPGERQYFVVGDIPLEGKDKENQVAKNVPMGVPWYSRLIATITEASGK